MFDQGDLISRVGRYREQKVRRRSNSCSLRLKVPGSQEERGLCMPYTTMLMPMGLRVVPGMLSALNSESWGSRARMGKDSF